MANFLFTVWPFVGCVNPQIAVARVLAARGHSVAFYTGKVFQDRIEQLGFRYFPFRHLDEQHISELLLSRNAMGRNWEQPWRLRPQIRKFFVDTVPEQLADLEKIYAEWKPAVMVTDPAMWAPYLLMSDMFPVQVAILSYACGCMLPGSGAPPMGLGLPVARTGWIHLANRVTGAVTDFFLSDTRRAANALRRRYGLSPFQGPVIGLAARLPLYLIPSSPDFDYRRRDLPECVQYVGPLQWYPPKANENILDHVRSDRPWVHVTEGTLHVREPFLLRAAALGLADLPLEVIITTGDERTADDLGLSSIPRNVHVLKWVNHEDLLPRIGAMVTTAGGGTVMAGMGAGIPLVVVPTEWDKAENAQRVVEAGAGIRLSPRTCTPRRLRVAVENILRDRSFSENARRIATSLRKQGGPDRAATLVESIAVRARQAAGAGLVSISVN